MCAVYLKIETMAIDNLVKRGKEEQIEAKIEKFFRTYLQEELI